MSSICSGIDTVVGVEVEEATVIETAPATVIVLLLKSYSPPV